MFEALKYLHVLTVVAAVAAAVIPELVLHAVARTGDVAAIRGFVTVTKPIGRAIPILFVLAAAFGFAAALSGSFDLLRPWLVASYAVFVIAMAVGGAMSGPWAQRLATAAFASPVEAPSPELQAAIHDRRGTISSTVLMIAIVVLIYLMVVKPGG